MDCSGMEWISNRPVYGPPTIFDGTIDKESEDIDLDVLLCNRIALSFSSMDFFEDSTESLNNVRSDIPVQTGPSTKTSAGVQAIEMSPRCSRTTAWAKQKTTCPHCGTHLLKKTLRRHIRSAHFALDKSIECNVCKATFKRQDILERHIREQHKLSDHGSGSVECVYCSQHVRERALKDHLGSRKCVAARARSDPEGEAMSALATHEASVETITSQQREVAFAIDPETLCCISLAILFKTQGVMRVKLCTRLGGFRLPARAHQRREPGMHFWMFRAMALRAL